MTRCRIILLFALLASARGDSLILLDGAVLNGTWAGVSGGEISFLADGVLRTFPKSQVSKVTFGSQASRSAIKAGQTTDEVTAALGQPKTVSDLGAKKIYIYPDVKVTFVDGKVTNVE
jgi:hypothetical protein